MKKHKLNRVFNTIRLSLISRKSPFNNGLHWKTRIALIEQVDINDTLKYKTRKHYILQNM